MAMQLPVHERNPQEGRKKGADKDCMSWNGETYDGIRSIPVDNGIESNAPKKYKMNAVRTIENGEREVKRKTLTFADQRFIISGIIKNSPVYRVRESNP